MLAIDKHNKNNITASMYPKETTPIENNWKDRSQGVRTRKGDLYMTVRNTTMGSGSLDFNWSCILHSWCNASHRRLYCLVGNL